MPADPPQAGRAAPGVGQTAEGFRKEPELPGGRQGGVPTLPEVPYRHAGQVAENDAARVAGGRPAAGRGKLGEILGDDGLELVGRREQPAARNVSGSPAHEHRIDDGGRRAVYVDGTAHLGGHGKEPEQVGPASRTATPTAW